MEKIRVFECFAGYGGASWGLRLAGIPHENIGYSEIKKAAIDCYEKNFPGVKNYGDITKINWQEVPDFDLLTGGYPCVFEDTLIKTNKGYKKIKDIKINDLVLTHTNSYKKVIKLMNRISPTINKIKAIGCDEQLITNEHPLFIKDKGWTKVKDIQVGDYIGINQNKFEENIFALNKNTCWLIGRYLADGMIQVEPTRERLIFCIGSKKVPEFKEHLEGKNYYICHPKRTCNEFIINNEFLLQLCSSCNNGSENKVVPDFILNLPKELLLEVWNGYISGDGHKTKEKNKRVIFSSVSKNLYLGLQDISIKLFNRTPTFWKRIDNRKETFKDNYQGTFLTKALYQYFDGNYLWVKITSKKEISWNKPVYNIEVEEDNSYTVDNLIVHNCQDVSTQGKQDLSGGRTVLVNNLIEALRVKQPKYFLFENVSNIQADKFKEFLRQIRFDLDKVGYQVFFRELQSCDYGTPNFRVRVWFIGYRKDLAKPFGFSPYPTPTDDFKVIEDILEPRSDKYLIPLTNNLVDSTKRRKKEIIDLGQYQTSPFQSAYKTLSPKGISQTLTCSINPSWLVDGKVYKPTEKELFRIQGFLNDEINLEGLSWGKCLDLAGDGWDVNLVKQIYLSMWKEELV